MGRARGSQRDPFTPHGSGRATDDEFEAQDVPPFVAKHRNPPYLNPRLVRRVKRPEGGD